MATNDAVELTASESTKDQQTDGGRSGPDLPSSAAVSNTCNVKFRIRFSFCLSSWYSLTNLILLQEYSSRQNVEELTFHDLRDENPANHGLVYSDEETNTRESVKSFISLCFIYLSCVVNTARSFYLCCSQRLRMRTRTFPICIDT